MKQEKPKPKPKLKPKLKPKPNSGSGLTLDYPRLIAAEDSLMMRFFFYFFLLLLGISAAYGCFYTAFPIPVSWRVVIPCAVVFAAAFTALFLKKGRGMRRSIRLPILVIGCLIVLFFFKDGLLDARQNTLIQGFIRTVNYVVFTYAQKVNYNFITLPAEPAGLSEITVFCTVFAVFVLFLVTLLMAWLLICRKNLFLCFLLTTPFLAVSLVFTIIPHYAAVTALLIFWAFLLLNASSLRSKKGLLRRGHVFYGDSNTVHPAAFILLPILAACLILVGVLFPMQSFQRSAVVEDLRSGLISRPNLATLFRSGGVAGNVNRVNLQFVGNISYTGKTILRVQSSQKDTEYLKGFVGSVYTGQSWEALGAEDYQELKALLNERKVQNFPYLFTDLLRSNLDRGLYEYDLTVQNVGGNPRSIYTPYGLVSGPEDLPGLDFVNDGYLRSGNSLFGTQAYTMKATSLPTDQYTTFYSRLAGRFMLNPWARGGRLAALDLSKAFQRDFSNSIRQMDEWTMPERLVDILSPEQASFGQAAQAYTRFVYAHYTQLPAELKDKLDQYRQEHDLDTEHFPWPQSLASAIINQVQSENTYTLSPGLMPSGRDFVEYFLFENHKGYCMHFASATVALLRSAGVPARYAEGYTVSTDDLVSPDGWADIPDSRAHAWAEIYLSGVGWVPVEATPGVRNGVIDHQAAAVASAEKAVGEPSEEDSPQLPEESSGEENSAAVPSQLQVPNQAAGAEIGLGGLLHIVKSTLLRVLPFLPGIVLLLSALALLLNRKLRVASRNKRLRQKNHNQAALAIYDYILQLLPHGEAAPSSTGGLPENLYELVLKARFSRDMLTEQELRKLLDYAQGLVDQTRGKASVFRRFIFEYIEVLF
ncbi:MAG TPA: transglutaminase domain-containing protein [Desulfosporosinus sp.]|nr:transglutaminase domain-containing protein [Desulfosporosinus sp.]